MAGIYLLKMSWHYCININLQQVTLQVITTGVHQNIRQAVHGAKISVPVHKTHNTKTAHIEYEQSVGFNVSDVVKKEISGYT